VIDCAADVLCYAMLCHAVHSSVSALKVEVYVVYVISLHGDVRGLKVIEPPTQFHACLLSPKTTHMIRAMD
jgi:hypothetical protein